MKFNKLIIALIVLQVTEAAAWEQITCILPINKGKKKHWGLKEFKPVIDPVSIPEGSPQYAALLDAVTDMNLNPSQFRYAVSGFDDGDGMAINNGESEIWLADLGPGYSKISAIEQSNSEYSPTCTATESDIIINTGYRPDREPVGKQKITYSNNKNELFEYGGSYSNVRSIVMHEFGHTAGLHHEGDVMNLMGGNNLLVTNGDVVQPYIGEDAASGLIALYGVSRAAKEDISVSHWRYGDKTAGGGGSFFSLHQRTRIFDAYNEELPKVCAYNKPDINGPLITACPEPVYQVSQGQKVKLELSYENAGKTRTLPIKANYYLSSDSTINTNDILLDSRTLSVKQDSNPSTLTTDLVIPRTVISGNSYWLGCIVDADDVVKESFETNNATYVGIKVK